MDAPIPTPETSDQYSFNWPPVIPDFPLLSDKPLDIGGFAEIYPAIQESVGGRRVCLKILRRRDIQSLLPTQTVEAAATEDIEKRRRRFREEAAITASLHSHYIPAVIVSGQAYVKVSHIAGDAVTVKWPYFVMEWIEGDPQRPDLPAPNLEVFLTKPEGPWSLGNGEPNDQRFGQLSSEWQQTLLVKIFTGVARALKDAHGKRILHRDVKPRNILVTHNREIKLIDWGVARRFESDANGQDVGAALKGDGTPQYMAPEQFQNAPGDVGFASDIYALGGIGFFLLTGQHPRSGDEAMMAAQAQDPSHHQALEERLRSSGAPEGFWVDLITRCLSFSSHARPQSAGEVVKEIDNYLAAQEGDKQGAKPQNVSHTRRFPRIKLIGVLFVAVAIVVATFTIAKLPGDGKQNAGAIDPEPGDKPEQTAVASLNKTKLIAPPDNERPKQPVPVDAVKGFIPLGTEALIRGNWQLDAKQLVQTSTNTPAFLFFGDQDWDDYVVELEARRLSGLDGFKIIIRALDYRNFHAFGFGSYGGKIHEVFWVENGNWMRSVNAVHGSIESDIWYKVRVETRGEMFRCFVDGNKLFEYSNQRFAKGRVGLSTWHTSVCFRDIRVTTPDGKKVLWEGLPEPSPR